MATNDAMYELAEHRDDTAQAVSIAKKTLGEAAAKVVTTDPAVYEAVIAAAPADAARVVLVEP
jgi:hypothetical protein